jgi:hypothetical protein
VTDENCLYNAIFRTRLLTTAISATTEKMQGWMTRWIFYDLTLFLLRHFL